MSARRSNLGFSRSERVAEQIHRDLVELLRQIKDPRIAALLPLMTITAVEVSNDYSYAKVFYTALLEAEQLATIASGLARSSSFLRRELGRRLHIHHIPELQFVHDAAVERGSRLSRLIEEAVASDSQGE